MAEIEFEIDGKTITAESDQTVIQAADQAGIYIPRFCYHKHLSAPANCRMCLVEIEKMPKVLPACATPVTPGMKVYTKSPKTLAAQRSVMEFLLINHPLDCPICDQGGECELQDLSMGYGSGQSNYDECKRSVADENLGPLIATEMTRCINCTRCVRFGDEIAGIRELGLIGRGEDTEISTYVAHAVNSEVSGNIIDICPVGALTSKPYRFTARSWELTQSPSISPHYCLGTNINVHTRNGKIMRVVSRENTDINETWLADRDRFSYTGLYHQDRLEEPMARIDGMWQPIGWKQALEMIASGLQQTIAEHGADKIGALVSPSATVEECFLLQKMMRELGCEHIDHRLSDIDTRDQHASYARPGQNMSLTELESCDAILLIGSHLPKEQPLAALRVRKAVLKGAKVVAINPVDYPFNFELAGKHIVAPHLLPKVLANLNQAISSSSGSSQNELTKLLLDHFNGKSKIAVILGAAANSHPQAAAIRFYAQQFAKHYHGKLMMLREGANSAGAWLAGAVPHQFPGGRNNESGHSAQMMLHKPRKAYVLLNVDPALDSINPSVAVSALKQAKFIAAISLYRSESLESHAHVILPMAAFTETSGTFVNHAGEWQSFQGVATPFANSRPAWKILRALANFLQLKGFEYQSSEEIKGELKSILAKAESQAQGEEITQEHAQSWMPVDDHTALSRIGDVPLYAVDSIVRHAKPLQIAQEKMYGPLAILKLHPKTADKLSLAHGDSIWVKQGHGKTKFTVYFDEAIAIDAAWLPGGLKETCELGDLYGALEILKA